VLLNDATFRRDSDLLLSRFTDIATEVEREKRERRHIQRAEQRPAYLRIADDFRFLDQTLRRMVVAHPFVVRTLLGVISLSLIGMLVLFYLYVANARLVDEQLRRGPFSQTTQIYSAPRRLSVGDKLSMNSLIEILNRDAYVDSALNRNGVSTYTRLPLEGVIHITLGPPDPRKRHC
jgi:hypothetical protein